MATVWDKAMGIMGFTPEDAEEQSGQRVIPKTALGNFPPTNFKKGNFQIRIIEPRDPEQSTEIANSLREGTPVIISLKYLEVGEAKRLFDFICGTAFAIDGQYRKLGDNILLFTPSNINITDNKEDAGVSGIDNVDSQQSRANER
ncbi:MAG: cell division protein SepF [Candidatus Margulisiibacteriota bacterium]|jgi:cell division inhibitor SepF